MACAPTAGAASASARHGLWLAVVVLTALNLRPFLSAIGPLTNDIAAATGLDLRGIAWLTLLPMLLMGLGAFFGPALQQRLGARRVVLGALAVLATGSALRAWAPGGTALIATAGLCGLGVAFVQAVFPGVIKRLFPGHVAPVMGLYSAALMGGGALGALLTPLAAQGGHWRGALAWWAVPVLAALLLAWRALPRAAKTDTAHRGPSPTRWMLRRPRTWLLMLCFGLVNGGYASVVAWLAPYYQSLGWSAAASGSLVALLSVAQAAMALLLPFLAARRRDRRPWLWLSLALQAAGFAALVLWPDLAPRTWVLLLGAGLGGSFALTMVVVLDHLPDPAQAGSLSALMQGGGFMLAAAAPWVMATLHGVSGSFDTGWLVHLGCVALVAVLTVRFVPQHYAKVMRAPALA
jgi:CP family cyanate transporter-like MFS transporter